MKIEYSHYKNAYVQIPEDEKNYFAHSNGYVSFTSVSGLEITQNGALVVSTADGNIHSIANGHWVEFCTEAMGDADFAD
jgi:hypothetical protein